MNRMRVIPTALAFLVGMGLAAHQWAIAAEPPEQSVAKQILAVTGSQGGLTVHLGCGDGKLTAALHPNNSYLVHGLDADAENIASARKYIQSLGLYGKVSVERWTGKRLPYADNLVNLLVISDASAKIAEEEIQRVLAPLGLYERVPLDHPLGPSRSGPVVASSQHRQCAIRCGVTAAGKIQVSRVGGLAPNQPWFPYTAARSACTPMRQEQHLTSWLIKDFDNQHRRVMSDLG
jgi:hypothetical protein